MTGRFRDDSVLAAVAAPAPHRAGRWVGALTSLGFTASLAVAPSISFPAPEPAGIIGVQRHEEHLVFVALLLPDRPGVAP